MPETRSGQALTRRQMREWERLQILATLREYGPMTGLDVVARANSERICEAFEALPDLTNRGIAAKLSGLWHAGFVIGERETFTQSMLWRLTNSGREFLRRGLVGLGQEGAR